MAQFYPAAPERVIGGPARIMIAPATAPLPTRMSEVFNVTTYVLNGTYEFVDIGTTQDKTDITHQASRNAWRNQQYGEFDSIYRDWKAQIKSAALEWTIANRQYLMNGVDNSGSQPAGFKRTDWPAAKVVPHYRLAVAFRDQRGKLHCDVFPDAQWSGADLMRTYSDTDPVTIPLDFVAYATDEVLSAEGDALFGITFDEET